VRKIALNLNGTSLTLPKFGRRIRIQTINCSAASAAGPNFVTIKDGAGNESFFSTGTATFNSGFEDAASNAGTLPSNCEIEETDVVEFTTGAPVTGVLVVTYEELTD